MSEWKPGDVAMVQCSDGEWRRAAYLAPTFEPPVWLFENNSRRHASESAARPLAVIDPEDREQVERLHTLWCEAIVSKGTSSRQVDSMQAALREFATPRPPKPERPTGLGAVVRDSTDVEFVHLGSDLWTYGTTDGPASSFTWDELDAVEVLSQGWSA